MSSLQGIGYNTAGCAIVSVFTFGFFAVAVRARSYNIAPRCTARPRNTIYNPKARRGKFSFFLFDREKYSRKKSDDDPGSNVDGDYDSGGQKKEEVQYRGGPMFGWIPWTLSLSYDTLWKGVPGTGTRKDGMEGSLLKVNMDGIVLLRFHALCLKVAIAATIIGCGFILPLNLSARCFKFSEDDIIPPQCNSSDYNITNYEQTTLSNIPSLDITGASSWQYGFFGSTVTIFGSKFSEYLGRLYAAVAFSWCLVLLTLRLIRHEWVEALAMRRAYYLEGLHWENRTSELEETMTNAEDSDDDEDDLKPGALNKRRMKNKRIKKKKKKALRDPWIPHPEQRETVPNIELYSVLVGNIPSVPAEIMGNSNDVEKADIEKSIVGSLDWQQNVTAGFFHQCVPRQPGFSSSVAAVTILPDAPKLAAAWRAWYKHVGVLRRLRFIRTLIDKHRYYEIDEVAQNSDSEEDEESKAQKPMTAAESMNAVFDSPKKTAEGKTKLIDDNQEDHLWTEVYEDEGFDEQDLIAARIKYFSEVFGTTFDEHDELGKLELEHSLMKYVLEYGPEQTSVFAREFAQGAAACCPHGCREERLHEYDLTELEKHFEETAERLKVAFEDLVAAQNQNILNEIDLAQEESPATEQDIAFLDSQFSKNEKGLFPIKDTSIKGGEEFVTQNYHDSEHEEEPDKAQERTAAIRPSSRLIKTEQSAVGLQDYLPHDNSMSLRFASSGGSMPRPPTMVLSAQGKMKSIMTNVHDDVSVAAQSYGTGHGVTITSDKSVRINEPLPAPPSGEYDNEIKPSLSRSGAHFRRRLDTGNRSIISMSVHDDGNEWEKFQGFVQDDNRMNDGDQNERVHDGVWNIPSIGTFFSNLMQRFVTWMKTCTKPVNELKSESTFAVVTFTSRQAAVAARHCLADGRGAKRWTPVEEIPVPPLADAAACDFVTCRGCCRPVTLTINSQQQFLRTTCANIMLALIFVFYTVPLTVIGNLASKENLEALIPGLAEIANQNAFVDRLLQGFIPALLFSLFFALCPVMFKAISNFGSNAISVNQAEFKALQYYWWFMLFTAFSGTTLAQFGVTYVTQRSLPGNNTFTDILIEIAKTLPGKVSSQWLNWIILRTFIVLPLQYMLQVNTFLFQWLGWKCCRRCVMGGGPGGPIPYRIYIDSGVVFMCIVALTPVAPLIGPAALIYFLYCAPLWRRNCIYVYRPKFDTGGLRWPFISDMLFSSLFIAVVLLTTAMALKEAVGPAFLSALAVIPIYVSRRDNRRRFLRAYLDCALLQTSQLDGWDVTQSQTSFEKRAEYLKFLVDAHKAAYVPICISGGSTSALTREEAIVVAHENDPMDMDESIPLSHMHSHELDDNMHGQNSILPTFDQIPQPVQLPSMNHQFSSNLVRPRNVERRDTFGAEDTKAQQFY